MLDAYQLRFLHSFFFFLMIRRPPRSTLFPYNDALPISHTMLVPVQYQRLMQCPGFDGADLSRLQHKFCTSAPFHPALKAEVLRRWPGRLIEYYGMTRSEEHTSELQSLTNLVCPLLL